MVLELTSRLEAQKATGHKQGTNYAIKAQGRDQELIIKVVEIDNAGIEKGVSFQ